MFKNNNTFNSVVGSVAGLAIAVLQASVAVSSTATDLAMANPFGSVPAPSRRTLSGANPPGAIEIGYLVLSISTQPAASHSRQQPGRQKSGR